MSPYVSSTYLWVLQQHEIKCIHLKLYTCLFWRIIAVSLLLIFLLKNFNKRSYLLNKQDISCNLSLKKIKFKRITVISWGFWKISSFSEISLVGCYISAVCLLCDTWVNKWHFCRCSSPTCLLIRSICWKFRRLHRVFIRRT